MELNEVDDNDDVANVGNFVDHNDDVDNNYFDNDDVDNDDVDHGNVNNDDDVDQESCERQRKTGENAAEAC